MSAKRKTHSAKFKAKVALEAYKGDKTATELISTTRSHQANQHLEENPARRRRTAFRVWPWQMQYS